MQVEFPVLSPAATAEGVQWELKEEGRKDRTTGSSKDRSSHKGSEKSVKGRVLLPLKKKAIFPGAPGSLPGGRAAKGRRPGSDADSPGTRDTTKPKSLWARRDGVRGVAKSAGPALSASGAKAQAAAVPPQGRDGSKQGQESLVVSCIQD